MDIRAFNLVPGAAVRTDSDGTWIVQNIERDAEREVVFGYGLTLVTENVVAFGWNYCEMVNMVGMAIDRFGTEDIGTN